MSELMDSIERVMLGGPERRSRIMTDREKMIVAYHESGHAIVGQAMPEAMRVTKVTIVPRGMAGGYTLFLPDEDRTLTSASQYEAQLAVSLGGRIAEELVLGSITNGASDDINKVTKIARAMVTRFGMSPKLGPIAFGEKEELVFLGREISEQRNYSDDVARQIDGEVHRIVSDAYDRAKGILNKHKAVLDDMASALLEYETLDGERLKEMLGRIPRGSFSWKTQENGHGGVIAPGMSPSPDVGNPMPI